MASMEREILNKENTKIRKGGKRKKIQEAKIEPKKKQQLDVENGGGEEYENATVGNSSEKKELPPLLDLEKDVLDYIIGQDEQVRQIITAIYRSKVFHDIKSNVLIIGKSGTGKTATVTQIAKMLDIPYTIEDATKYTQEGYYGSDVIEMIYNLISSANNDMSDEVPNIEAEIQKARDGIIIIDEIDKKASNDVSNDVSGVEVLKSLLKIIEGSTVKIEPMGFFGETVPFDTSNLTIILMGAFPGLDKIRDRRLNRNAFGFSNSQQKTDSSKSKKYIKEDLIKYGMTEEFVGRIDTIIEMNALGVSELTEILKKSKLSIFRRFQKELKRVGVKLVFNDRIFEEIAEASLEIDTGARELSNTVNLIFEKIVYEVLAHPGKYKKCKLLPGIVKDNTRFELS